MEAEAFHLWAFEDPGEYYQAFIEPNLSAIAEDDTAIMNLKEAIARAQKAKTEEQKTQDRSVKEAFEAISSQP